MNTTDSAVILEAIHQGGLAKRGINPQPARPSRAPRGGTGRDGNFQGCLGVGRSQHFQKCQFGSIPRGEFCGEVLPLLRCAFPRKIPSWSFGIFALHSMPLREAFLKGGSAFPSSLQPESCCSWSLAQMMHFSTERGRLGFEMHPHSHILNLPLTTLQQQPEAQRDVDLGREQEQNTEWEQQRVRVTGRFL